MSGIKDQQNIDELRKRLYERGISPDQMHTPRHNLTETKVDVSRGWGVTNQLVVPTTPVVNEMMQEEALLEKNRPKENKHSYRKIIMLGSIGLFVVSALVASVYLFFGANQISVKNITISVNAPFAVAAGENLPLQVSIGNQNSVQIESATLIVNYPSGTKTSDDEARDLYEERIPVDDIKSGEAVNLPINVLLFGEENEDKEIKVSIEYRVTGSNGTFFKEAEPIKIKINSSPLVIRVDSIDKVSSGQEIEIKLTVKSNASVVQKNILISAMYPNSFSFLKSDPKPSYGQNEWLITEIKPDSSEVITLRGTINGLSGEKSELQFEAGTPKTDNQFIMGSILTKTRTGYTVERPFIDVIVDINQDQDGQAAIDAGVDSQVRVVVTNTLDETIYDMRVEVMPKGNLIRDDLLIIPDGFFDSNSKTIRYEVSGNPSLAKVLPGEKRDFSFSIKPDPNQDTASFDISTNVFARRVSEPSAAEEMVGTALAAAKYSSVVKLSSQASYDDGPFSDTGPIPPVADQATTYTITLMAEAGINDVTSAVVSTNLPQYVSWTNKFEGEGTVDYNPVSKQLRWNIGNIQAKTSKQLQFQVSLLPSVTQVGRNAVIVGAQELRATDRFTNTGLQARQSNINNELSTEAGFPVNNGVIQKKSIDQ